MKNQKGFSVIETFIVIVVIIGLTAAGLYVLNNNNNDNQNQGNTDKTKQNEKSDVSVDSSDVVSGTYSNEELGFSFDIPEGEEWNLLFRDFSIDEYSKGKSVRLLNSKSEDEEGAIYLKASTRDYHIEGTGLHPASFSASIYGYTERDGKFYVEESKQYYVEILNASKLMGTDGVCGVGQHSANGGPNEYMCVFNTKTGGLVVATYEEDLFNEVKELSKNVEIIEVAD